MLLFKSRIQYNLGLRWSFWRFFLYFIFSFKNYPKEWTCLQKQNNENQETGYFFITLFTSSSLLQLQISALRTSHLAWKVSMVCCTKWNEARINLLNFSSSQNVNISVWVCVYTCVCAHPHTHLSIYLMLSFACVKEISQRQRR